MTETADQPVTLEELRRITAEIRKNGKPFRPGELVVWLGASMMAQLSPDELAIGLGGIRDEAAAQGWERVRVVFVPSLGFVMANQLCPELEVQLADSDPALLELAEVIHGTLESWRSGGE